MLKSELTSASTERLSGEAEAVVLTDEQRLAFVRELVAFQYQRGFTHTDQALWAYEREAKGRAGR
jgi:hypothetical protein